MLSYPSEASLDEIELPVAAPSVAGLDFGAAPKRPDVFQIVEHGSRLSICLDGSTAEIHDGFRGVAGSYDRTLDTLHAARELGLDTQVNTTLGRHNVDDLHDLILLLLELNISLWSLSFPVPKGRASAAEVASPEEFERLFHRVRDLSAAAPFPVRTTAAPQYRRVLLQRRAAERVDGGNGAGPVDGIGGVRHVNDGNGQLCVQPCA